MGRPIDADALLCSLHDALKYVGGIDEAYYAGEANALRTVIRMVERMRGEQRRCRYCHERRITEYCGSDMTTRVELECWAQPEAPRCPMNGAPDLCPMGEEKEEEHGTAD